MGEPGSYQREDIKEKLTVGLRVWEVIVSWWWAWYISGGGDKFEEKRASGAQTLWLHGMERVARASYHITGLSVCLFVVVFAIKNSSRLACDVALWCSCQCCSLSGCSFHRVWGQWCFAHS